MAWSGKEGGPVLRVKGRGQWLPGGGGLLWGSKKAGGGGRLDVREDGRDQSSSYGQ